MYVWETLLLSTVCEGDVSLQVSNMHFYWNTDKIMMMCLNMLYCKCSYWRTGFLKKYFATGKKDVWLIQYSMLLLNTTLKYDSENISVVGSWCRQIGEKLIIVHLQDWHHCIDTKLTENRPGFHLNPPSLYLTSELWWRSGATRRYNCINKVCGQRSSSSPPQFCLIGVEVRSLCRPLKFVSNISLCTVGHCHVKLEKGLPQSHCGLKHYCKL